MLPTITTTHFPTEPEVVTESQVFLFCRTDWEVQLQLVLRIDQVLVRPVVNIIYYLFIFIVLFIVY